MTLHLIKLCVGADSLADLREWMAARMAEAKRRGAPLRHAHVTRMAPKRAADILDGGSLYWVIKGQIGARQRDRRHRAVHRLRWDRPLQAVARRRRGRGRAAADAAPFRAGAISRRSPRRRTSTRPSPASPTCRRRCGASSPGSGSCK